MTPGPAAVGDAAPVAAALQLSAAVCQLIELYRYTTDAAGAPVERSAAAVLVCLRGHRDTATTVGQVHAYLAAARARRGPADSPRPVSGALLRDGG